MAKIFFFQAEDGIRDRDVTGVQTCALPIYRLTAIPRLSHTAPVLRSDPCPPSPRASWPPSPTQIGRASCRERVENAVVGVRMQQKSHNQVGDAASSYPGEP